MKKNTKKRVWLLLLLGSMLGYSQQPQDAKKALLAAQLQLVEKSKNYNPTAALTTYQQLAAEDNAEAMNGLGLIYSKGLGVAVDEQTAIQWFEKAASNGYAKAWYNLGLLYKEGIGAKLNLVKAVNSFEKSANSGYDPAWQKWGFMVMKGEGLDQDYITAFSIFKQGADKGEVGCIYSLGYLYYKGFGCTQDYNKAVQLFELAAGKRNASSMYMLGLCYRNGYGVAIDSEKAKFWLNKSAAMGYKQASTELAASHAENANPNQVKTVSSTIPEVTTIKEASVPKNFQKVKQQVISQNVGGSYTGYLMRYDWSGQNMISRTPIQIELKQAGQNISGEWKEENGAAAQFNAEIKDDAIVFNDSKIDRIDHFNSQKPATYDFKEARLQLLSTNESLFIVGNLQLYNSKERENEKPMYLILEKKQEKANDVKQLISSVIIHPNPVVSDFNLSFDLAEGTDVTLGIFDIAGRPMYSEKWQGLVPGKQSKTIVLNALAGYYILRLTYGNEEKTTILIKK